MSNVDDNWLETLKSRVESVPAELPEGGADAFCAEAARMGHRRAVRTFVAVGFAAAASLAAFLILQPAFQSEGLHIARNVEMEEPEQHPAEVSADLAVASDAVKDDAKQSVRHMIDSGPSAETHQARICSDVFTELIVAGTSDKPSDFSTEAPSSTAFDGNVALPAAEPVCDPFGQVDEVDSKKRSSVRSVSCGLHLAFNDDASGISRISQSSVVQMDGYFSSPRAAVLYKGYHTEYEYFKPINIGLSLSVDLTDRISLETGFDYSLHRLRLHNFLNSTELDSDMQILHFVGIPLGLRFVAFESGRSSIYGYTGVETQKCIYASWNGSRMNISPVILSNHFSAGWQYSVADFLGLYAEPGISYYDAISDASYTIYSKSPWQFELRAGLRFSM